MKTAPIGIALLALLAWPAAPVVPAAHACELSFHSHGLTRLRAHQDPADARIAINTRNGKVTLLLTDRYVAFQLSDGTLRRVRRELRDAEDDQDSPFASAIVIAVTATVRGLIDHSVVCPVSDLRDVSYRDGHLEFRDHRGRLVFDDGAPGDPDSATAFSERDAQNFVREFQRLKDES